MGYSEETNPWSVGYCWQRSFHRCWSAPYPRWWDESYVWRRPASRRYFWGNWHKVVGLCSSAKNSSALSSGSVWSLTMAKGSDASPKDPPLSTGHFQFQVTMLRQTWSTPPAFILPAAFRSTFDRLDPPGGTRLTCEGHPWQHVCWCSTPRLCWVPVAFPCSWVE